MTEWYPDIARAALVRIAEDRYARGDLAATAELLRMAHGKVVPSSKPDFVRGLERVFGVGSTHVVAEALDVDGAMLEQAERAKSECAAAEVSGLRERLARAETALQKIDAIRNTIIGHQSINWSRDIYPLVAALGEAGYPGEGYEVARAKSMAHVDVIERLEAEVGRLRTQRDSLVAAAEQAPSETPEAHR